MSRIEKLIERLKSRPSNFTWSELQKVMNHFGYVEIKGKGSRRKFVDQSKNVVILHEPHPKPVLKKYMIDLILKNLNLVDK